MIKILIRQNICAFEKSRIFNTVRFFNRCNIYRIKILHMRITIARIIVTLFTFARWSANKRMLYRCYVTTNVAFLTDRGTILGIFSFDGNLDKRVNKM